MTRKSLTLTADIQKPQVENEYEATLLAPGTHNGWTFLAEEITRAAATMEGQPVNLNHSRAVEDEVGFVKGVKVVEGRLRGFLALTPQTQKFAIAKAFIENRQRAGKAPEVSVGVSFMEEVLENGTVLARDLSFDHLALVTRGACSPEKGCGVGLSKENVNMEPETPPAPAAGEAPPAPAPAEASPPAEATSEPTPAPLAAEKPPCGCHDLEKALLAEKEAHAKASADLAEETKARSRAEADLAALRDSIPERLALLAKARDLGLEATGSEDIAVLKQDISKAERVAAHLAAKNSASPATGPTTPASGAPTGPKELAKDEVGRKAADLLRKGGFALPA